MERDFGFFHIRDFAVIDGIRYRVLDVVGNSNGNGNGDATVFCIESDNPRIRIRKYSLSELIELYQQGKLEVIITGDNDSVPGEMDEEDLCLMEKRQKIMQEALGLIYPNYDAFEHRRGKEVIEYICEKLVVSDSSARFLLNRYMKSGLNPLSLLDMRQGWNSKEKSAMIVNGRMNKDGTHSKVTLNEETLNNFEMAFRYFKENCGAGINLSDAYNYLIDIYYTDENTLEKLPDDECPSYRRFRSYVEKNLEGESVRDFTRKERDKFKALPEEERKVRTLPGLPPVTAEPEEDNEIDENNGPETAVDVEPDKTETIVNRTVNTEGSDVMETSEEEKAKQDEEPVQFDFQQEISESAVHTTEQPVPDKKVQEDVKEEAAEEATEEAAEEAAEEATEEAAKEVKEELQAVNSKEVEEQKEKVITEFKDEITEETKKDITVLQETAETGKKPLPEDYDYIDLDSEIVEEEKQFNAGEKEETAESVLNNSAFLEEARIRKEKKEEREQEIRRNKNLFLLLAALAAVFVILLVIVFRKPSPNQSESMVAAETVKQTEASKKESKTEPKTEPATLIIETSSEKEQETEKMTESIVSIAETQTITVETRENEEKETAEKESEAELILPETASEESAAVPETSPAETTAAEIKVPETKAPETAAPQTTASETTVPETLPVETTEPASAEERPAEQETVIAEAETKSEEKRPAPKTGEFYTVNGSSVNIRRKNAKDQIIDSVPGGTIVQVTGNTGDSKWTQISFRGTEAVIYSDYLTKNNAASHGQYYKLTGDRINVRDAADRSIIYTSLPKGIVIEETQNYSDPDWIRFQWNGKDVVLSRRYAAAVVEDSAVNMPGNSKEGSTENSAKKNSAAFYRITGRAVNVRDARYKEVVIRSYPKGMIIEKKGDSGSDGWIMTELNQKAAVISSAYLEPVSAADEYLCRIKRKNTPVCSAANTAEVLDVLPAGMILAAENPDEDSIWVKFTWKGKTACVDRSMTEDAE